MTHFSTPTTKPQGFVNFVGAGPGAVQHLTLGALRAIQGADVILYDRLIGPEILALIPTKAATIEVGKTGFGPSTPQVEINTLLVSHARAGAQVVRMKAGDSGIFGRLDEEIEALEAASLPFAILPGLTAATVAAATIGQSLTKRGRNASVRFLTGHDVAGYAEQDWRSLAKVGQVAAIYMGKKSARFLQGRLLMHGANPQTAVTLVENISRADQQIIASNLERLAEDILALTGPAVLLYGLKPRQAQQALAHVPIMTEVRA
ncbi:MAG: uroporphyrinogen-III C-methyltransferase [Proteobacteria bacterium]|nr:uroporphyrinogen-III C-methyltransferase [Pseudomonadota bacterium]